MKHRTSASYSSVRKNNSQFDIYNKQTVFVFYPQSISLKTNCKKLAVFLIRLNGWALPRLFVSSYLDDYMEKQEVILQNLYILHNRLL